ncbi:MAG: transcriptional regulator [Rhodospirillaceae bacterium]|nr:transcriptional regulator [Rhodospirillaceae bacterium]|tara:strand:- start:4436 stop:5542 length:1107 start_codon:yes stop_codon:yes gene_type:complete
MKVEYNYLPKEFEDCEAIIEEWRKLINTTDFTLGAYVEAFEEKFRKAIGADYCIAVNCGTDALILSLKGMGIGVGDEVITVANTFYASVGAIVAVGATPVLVDCDDRFQIDATKIEAVLSSQTKAIMPVHWAGASPDMEPIIEICKRHELLMIEDACMGIGASVDGQSPGTFGNINAFSMHPLKSLNAMGDGGMVASSDTKFVEWMRKYRNHGMVDRDHIEFWGINMRMQPLQCVVLSQGLDRLNDTIEKRNKNAKILDEGLGDLKQVSLPRRLPKNIETFALYMGLFEERDKLIQYLNEKGIEAKIHYPLALHQQKAAKEKCIFDPETLEKSTLQANKLITLPVHQFLREEQLNYTVNTIREFYGKN